MVGAGCSRSKEEQGETSPEPVRVAIDAALSTEPSADETRAARILLERFECNRCHHGTGLDEPPAPKQCVGCHEALLSGDYEGAFADQPELVAEWRKNIVSLPAAPSLAAIGRRLRREWVRDQLRQPRDQRPHLRATMPRLRMSDEDAGTLARALVPRERPKVTFEHEDVARGRELYGLLGCEACHEFTGVSLPPRAALPEGLRVSARARALAPDLRGTRERFQSCALVEWLRDPKAVDPHTEMPSFTLSGDDARALAAFVWLVDVGPVPVAPTEDEAPAPASPPSWEQVSERIFKKLCWHCHSSKAFARGDGGPGNTGGFGFAARGLDLSSYEGVLSGAIGEDGRRRSIFAKDANGEPRLMRVLRLRKEEERGHHRDDLRGMPLGFPSLSEADLALLQAWIDAGRPR